MNRQLIFDYIKKEYNVLPENPWQKYDGNTVFRHADKEIFCKR